MTISGSSTTDVVAAPDAAVTALHAAGVFDAPSYGAGLLIAAMIIYLLVKVPLDNAGRADEPAPPAAMM